MKKGLREKRNSERGVSIVEILVALVIIVVLGAISLPYITNYKKYYKSEDQTLKFIDVMREAAQLALTRRRSMRVEIDLTDNVMLIIDEKGTAADTLVKSIPLEPTREVRMDQAPTGITKPNPPNYTDAAFATDSIGHLVGSTTVTGHNVWMCRFQSDGSVLNAAGNPLNATIYVWPPVSAGSTTIRNKTEARAITLFGGSGAIRYWKHDGSSFVSNE